jgi:hypothetical protein
MAVLRAAGGVGVVLSGIYGLGVAVVAVSLADVGGLLLGALDARYGAVGAVAALLICGLWLGCRWKAEWARERFGELFLNRTCWSCCLLGLLLMADEDPRPFGEMDAFAWVGGAALLLGTVTACVLLESDRDPGVPLRGPIDLHKSARLSFGMLAAVWCYAFFVSPSLPPGVGGLKPQPAVLLVDSNLGEGIALVDTASAACRSLPLSRAREPRYRVLHPTGDATTLVADIVFETSDYVVIRAVVTDRPVSRSLYVQLSKDSVWAIEYIR